MLTGILDYSHHLLKTTVNMGDTVIDATCGNGNDTLFLSKLVGDEGEVIAFDIQEQAIKHTEQLLKKHNRTNTTIIHDSHAYIKDYLPTERKAAIGGAIFNLGYLPKSDKTIITKKESTLAAVKTILEYLQQNRIIVIVVYHGHEGGREEKDAIVQFVRELDQKKFRVLRYEFINQINNPPFIIAIQKNSEIGGKK